MELYVGLDLHARNTYLGIINGEGKKMYKRRVPNSPKDMLRELSPYRQDVVGVVVESTFNWYWLVDELMEHSYQVHLANPTAIQKYKGLKYADDQHDAFWLAELLRLGILPEGYIYPREERPFRDLLRKRGHLVRVRTALMISLKNIIARNCGIRVPGSTIKMQSENHIEPLLRGNQDLALAGKASKEVIDFLTGKILEIEEDVLGRVRGQEPYRYLQTLPGVGKILSLTITLETGPISRFPKAGNYVSYCRKVPSEWLSDGKVKGRGNRKSGNKYLAWAYSEAALMARRYDPTVRTYYERKKQKTSVMAAHNAVAHKLARAAYHVMRDQVPFAPVKLFG